MEILDSTSTPQEHKEYVTTTGKATYVLCPLNLNKQCFGALRNSNHCKKCEYFIGLAVYPNNTVLPRLQCGASGDLRLLGFYVNCHNKHKKCIKSSLCKRCSHFTSLDASNGYLNCGLIKIKSPKIVQLFPQKQLSVNFPFPIPCAKTGNTCTVELCVKCQFFKGIYTRSTVTKLCCTHSKSVKSEYILHKFAKPKQPKEKTLHTPYLSWLFEDSIKIRKLSLKVDCLGADRRHYSQNLNVNCLSNGVGIAECRLCPEHLGVKVFRIDCKRYPTAIFIPHCPHGKGATHQKGSQVSLQTCMKCPQFLKIVDERVYCRYTKLQGYVSNPPSRTSKISKLTRKPKFYYDIPD